MRIDEVILKEQPGLDQYAQMIQRDCAEYLAKSAGGIMLRGMKGVAGPVATMRCPVDRTPRNTPQLIHEFADAWFDTTFGTKFRSNAVFTTGKFNQAQSYGDVYAIFPMGEFRFCWSPKVSDMTTDIVDDHLIHLINDDDTTTEYHVNNVLNHAMYQTTDLKRAIKSGNEIMINCGHYYAVEVELVDRIMAIINTQ